MTGTEDWCNLDDGACRSRLHLRCWPEKVRERTGSEHTRADKHANPGIVKGIHIPCKAVELSATLVEISGADAVLPTLDNHLAQRVRVGLLAVGDHDERGTRHHRTDR